MVNLYDNPAEAKFIQTYTPIDFEGLKNLAMQAKDDRDKNVKQFQDMVASGNGLGSINDLHNAYYDNLITNPINQIASEAASSNGTFFNDPANMARMQAATSMENSSEAKLQKERAAQGIAVKNNSSKLGYGDAGYVDEAFAKTINPDTGRAETDFNLPDISKLDDDVREAVKTTYNKTYRPGEAGIINTEEIDAPKLDNIVYGLSNNGVFDDKLKGSYDYEMYKLNNGKTNMETSPLRMAISGYNPDNTPIFDFNKYKTNYMYSVANPQRFKRKSLDLYPAGIGKKGVESTPLTWSETTKRDTSTAMNAYLRVNGSHANVDPDTGIVPDDKVLVTTQLKNYNNAFHLAAKTTGNGQDIQGNSMTAPFENASNTLYYGTPQGADKINNVLFASGLNENKNRIKSSSKTGDWTGNGGTTSSSSSSISFVTSGNNGGYDDSFFTPMASAPLVNSTTKDGSDLRRFTSIAGTYRQYGGIEGFTPGGMRVEKDGTTITTKTGIGVVHSLQAEQLVSMYASKTKGIQFDPQNKIENSMVAGQTTEELIPGTITLSASQVSDMKKEFSSGKLKAIAESKGFDLSSLRNLKPDKDGNVSINVRYHPRLDNVAVRVAADARNGEGNTTFKQDPESTKAQHTDATKVNIR